MSEKTVKNITLISSLLFILFVTLNWLGIKP